MRGRRFVKIGIIAGGLLVLALPLLAYGGLCGWFWVHQREVIYALGGMVGSPEEAGLSGFSVVEIATEDGERIAGWWLPPPRAEAGVVLFLHGTADPNVPIDEARRLFAAAHEPKRIIEVEGAGHLAAWEGGAAKPALEALAAWTAPAER